MRIAWSSRYVYILKKDSLDLANRDSMVHTKRSVAAAVLYSKKDKFSVYRDQVPTHYLFLSKGHLVHVFMSPDRWVQTFGQYRGGCDFQPFLKRTIRGYDTPQHSPECVYWSHALNQFGTSAVVTPLAYRDCFTERIVKFSFPTAIHGKPLQIFVCGQG